MINIFFIFSLDNQAQHQMTYVMVKNTKAKLFAAMPRSRDTYICL